MTRIIITFGGIAGTVIIASAAMALSLGGQFPEWAGYLIMLAALSMVFIGTKRYRDSALGGVIRFPTALGVGLGIAAVASGIYVAGWELYLWSTGYTFFDSYAAGLVEAKRAGGASAAEIAKLTSDMAAMGEQYSQPLYRMAITLFEILPVGVVVALISAALLRNSKFLPVHGHRVMA